PAPHRLARRAPRQRVDARALPGVRPGRAPRAMEVRGHMDAGVDPRAPDGAPVARRHGGELGVGAGHGRRHRHGTGGTHRCEHAGKEHALLNMSGSPNRPLPLPQLAVAHEDFALFDRLLGTGTTPRLAVTIANTLTRDSVTQWNTVAEIPGSEHPGQVVIVGAHLDSWDLGAGATDNGTGAMCTLETARVIAQSGLKPKRTIRFVL